MDRPADEDQRDSNNAEGREIWRDHNDRQEFEHLLIDRKTNWLLATESILFAAFALSFQADRGVMPFRIVLSACAAVFAVISAFGIERIVESKQRSWTKYAEFFASQDVIKPPRPFRDDPLQWGVDTANTRRSLLPDRLVPWIFVVAWLFLLIWSATQ